MSRPKFSFLQKKRSVREIMQDKDLAKLGDNLVNLACAMARSRVLGKPTGCKVSKKILGGALKRSSFAEFIPRRSSLHDVADYCEALCAHAWLTETITLEKMQECLHEVLIKGDFSSRKNEEIAMTEAFLSLLNQLKKEFDL
ncbi:MAG: ribonuclease III family protein [Candidatus Helarchaeales archaeon]